MMAENATHWQSYAVRFLKGLRPLFYLEPPSESRFERLPEVPDYIERVVPYFLVFIAVEAVVRVLQGKPLPRLNDSINSMSAGLILSLSKIVTGLIEVVLYVWVYERFCVFALPWDSVWTWWLAFLGVDFFYYWFHRMAHEVNLFWAAHQVHHSSEDYTLSTALRQSVFQRFSSWFFYLPMALCVPPSTYLVHKQFNLLFQFWIHTEVIDRLGPLEWILNTPSHHRVHHGRNPYCIDKNYGGTLIVFDRLFGTFESERKEERVVYGLVHPLGTWDPLWAQVHHLVYLWGRLWEEKGVGGKLSVLLKGPGWVSGSPRLGWHDQLPQVSPDEKPYDREVPRWLNLYCAIHFLLVLFSFQEIIVRSKTMPYLLSLVLVIYFIISITNFGLMFELNPRCAVIEVARLVALLGADYCLFWLDIPTELPSVLLLVVRMIAVFSLCLWSAILVKQAVTPAKRDQKKD